MKVPDLESGYSPFVSGQWNAFDKVLSWINTQEKKMISKGDLYDAVLEMRPENP
ncbi:hypothetical protein [Shimia sp.]|uniref:hypothetical protein n=1 Tax=Shimia sp. TaxID=1954381 RepID=UPI003BAA90C4